MLSLLPLFMLTLLIQYIIMILYMFCPRRVITADAGAHGGIGSSSQALYSHSQQSSSGGQSPVAGSGAGGEGSGESKKDKGKGWFF